jgi:hypothetical protein
MHLAERSLFLNIARVLWGFNVNRKKDENGNEIPIDFGLSGTEPGSNCTPKRFACGMKYYDFRLMV